MSRGAAPIDIGQAIPLQEVPNWPGLNLPLLLILMQIRGESKKVDGVESLVGGFPIDALGH